MKFSSAFLYVLSSLGVAQAKKSPYFVLTGDSTVAVNGGWGDGFLADLKSPASGVNSGKSGATIPSFRAEGRWNTAIEAVKSHKGDHESIVTIQFGHNDQKTYTLEQYSNNLAGLVNEVKAAGGTPIVITSLTRRTFSGGHVVENLSEWRDAAIAVAKDLNVQYLDLNTASTNYINAIGKENADYYNLSEGDRTHLNPAGEIVFGRLVADLLLEKRPDLKKYVIPNEELSRKLREGEFATGEE
ncbi:hypothetical protein NW754_009300 [Fusarium falciforme]|uniref:SGNH hydrolase-type esterase domain-containing protein n=1 Tax=Fusarium falciforme TaxID=195108 RepID=A0A9W8R2A2_9HYPO|nr:hypothetical protein NW754_009300 [Fusarium falciforme]KAJ4185692.1 hypothetical protein NW755_008140 [Fusarium falciforme]KAJ4206800.1 hypothetical protein NW767_003090 [Fusarium falciforme]KAJ4260866.1 hypothetical protein NW757_001252 [Fusarium falciforme]